MVATQADGAVPVRGLSTEVVVCGLCFVASSLVSALATMAPGEPRPVVWFGGWPILALLGGALLDARPGSRPGRVLTALALIPVLDVGWAVARFGMLTSPELAQATAELAALQAAAALVSIPWALRTPRSPRAAYVLLGALAGGAVTVLLAEAGAVPTRARLAGWLLVVVGCAGIWSSIAGPARSAGRSARRQMGWVLAVLAGAGLVTGAGWLVLSDELAGYVSLSVLIGAALAVLRLCLLEEFRPAMDHLLDLAVAVTALGTTALAASLVWLGARLGHLPSAATAAAFSALLVAAVVAPAALWVRRAALARRYGSGTIPPSDVATLTADLHARTDARDLLENAARIVVRASGSRAARIVLGAELPQLPEDWVIHRLAVGDDLVGALLIDSGNAEGPELRQQRIIEQLRPTVALVARAVGLAVEAEHARRDVSRERDAERRRILGDLHDGLGPVLAGMSMRVQAALRQAPPEQYAGLLADLSHSLTVSRTDLRRIVSGIAPSVLDGGDLEVALHQLVDSFAIVATGPRIHLDSRPEEPLDREVQVAVYRSVAEGVTNALRHGNAATVTVSLRTSDGRVLVDVTDDGTGGRVVPGVGLSSLSERARGLGGCLQVAPCQARGIRLHLDLPTQRGDLR